MKQLFRLSNSAVWLNIVISNTRITPCLLNYNTKKFASAHKLWIILFSNRVEDPGDIFNDSGIDECTLPSSGDDNLTQDSLPFKL